MSDHKASDKRCHASYTSSWHVGDGIDFYLIAGII